MGVAADSVRWGLLSTAKINERVLKGAGKSDRVRVVAVGSRDEGRAETYAREHDLERAYGSYEELLADPEIDAVYISLPNALHVDWCVRALEAGKHVLCEKPLDRRPERVEGAFAAAERCGRLLMEGFMWRHHPQTERLVELVEGVRSASCGSSVPRSASCSRDRATCVSPVSSTGVRCSTSVATASARRGCSPASPSSSTACRRPAATGSTPLRRHPALRRRPRSRRVRLRDRPSVPLGPRGRRLRRLGVGRRPLHHRLAAPRAAARGRRRGGLRGAEDQQVPARAGEPVGRDPRPRPSLLGRAGALGQARALDALLRSAAAGGAPVEP